MPGLPLQSQYRKPEAGLHDDSLFDIKAMDVSFSGTLLHASIHTDFADEADQGNYANPTGPRALVTVICS